jgi:hypothetical protein
MLKRIFVASALATVLAIPALSEEAWHIHEWAPLAILLANFPGILCGFLCGGRFFPPEGYIGQSASRAILMVLVQALLWYLILCVLRIATGVRRKSSSDVTQSI